MSCPIVHSSSNRKAIKRWDRYVSKEKRRSKGLDQRIYFKMVAGVGQWCRRWLPHLLSSGMRDLFEDEVVTCLYT